MIQVAPQAKTDDFEWTLDLDGLYTEGAVVVGLMYNYLPFVILACYAPLARMNPELAEAWMIGK